MVDADQTASGTARRARSITLPLAVVFFVLIAAIRLPVMIAHQDTWYPFETHSGTIAYSLLSGFDLDIAHLPIVPHIRGGVLFGLLLVPFYAVLGASAFTLKLLPLLWHAATIALLVHLIERSGRRLAAIVAGALFVAAPPMLAKLSTIGLASHLESMLPMLLALAAWIRAAREDATPRHAALLGLAVGFAGFFHLQALLPCLAISGLYVLAGLRGRPAHLAAFALCLGLGAAPSFAFFGGNLSLLGASFDHGDKGEAESVADDGPTGKPPPPAQKLAALMTHDFAYALEFGEISLAHGTLLGGAYALLAAALATLGLVRDRRWLHAILNAFRLRRGPVPLESLFALHIVLVLTLYLVSHARHQEEIGAGLTNRHLAPAIFSLLALAALGTQSLRHGAWLVLPLVVAGGLALPKIASANAASRLPQRGENLEWALGFLELRTRPAELWEKLAECDRGDGTFRSLRFPLALARTQPDDPDFVAKERVLWTRLPRALFIATVTDAGRKFAPRLSQGLATRSNQVFGEFDAVETAAFFHGVGLELHPPRIADPHASPANFLKSLQRIARATTQRQMEAIAQGLGFQLGAVFEPYNANLVLQLRQLGEFPADSRAAFVTGLGWGARQRYLVPPGAVPEGLAIRAVIDSHDHPAFDAGFTGQVLPLESNRDR